jgi:hypothetical protein
MSKNDRNIVNIGPARVKVDDSIYDAVDQGVVGTTNVTTAVPDEGFTPIGPIGDLITPPVLDPVTGYPITAAAINFTESQLSPITPWAVLDLSALGSFANALVLSEGFNLSIVNLDNPSQKTTYAGGGKDNDFDFVVRDGYLTWGFDIFSGGVWTNPTYVLPAGGTKTASQLPSEPMVQDAANRYFNVSNNYYFLPHSGPLTPVLIGAGLTPIAYTPTVTAISGNVLWVRYTASGTNRIRPIEITTATVGPEIVIGSAFNSEIIWGLSTLSVAGLSVTTVGSNFVYDLSIVDIYGGITTQAALMTVPNTYSIQNRVPVPGSDICLVVFYDTATTAYITYQISTAGYQAITMPTARVRGLRISTANPSGFIRWWGSAADDTGDALYESAL